jgi:hypothetical protein
MTVRESSMRLTPFTLIVYWGCILLGFALPLSATIGIDLVKHHQSFGQAFQQLRLHLFAPGYNLFLIAAMNALPFVLFAVFTLLHLGLAPLEDQPLAAWRRLGILVAALGLVGLSTWTHVMTLWYPDAQGALAYFFLPFWQIILMPLSYTVGRLVGAWLIR